MSKIVIVDDNDKIIGHKVSDERTPDDTYRASLLWIKNTKGESLITLRSRSMKIYPGKWAAAVAGTVDEGETYYENIIKETQEELGLSDIKPIEGPTGRYKVEYNFFYRWYLLEIDKNIEDFNIDKEEVEEIRWITKDQLIKEIKENPNDFVPTMDEWAERLG